MVNVIRMWRRCLHFKSYSTSILKIGFALFCSPLQCARLEHINEYQMEFMLNPFNALSCPLSLLGWSRHLCAVWMDGRSLYASFACLHNNIQIEIHNLLYAYYSSTVNLIFKLFLSGWTNALHLFSWNLILFPLIPPPTHYESITSVAIVHHRNCFSVF